MLGGTPAGDTAAATGTIVQPAAADTVIIGVGSPPCGKSGTGWLPRAAASTSRVLLGVKNKTCSDSCRASFTVRS